MAILNNNPLVGASGNQGGYNINNSLRLRSSASAYLNRTPASTTNRQTWTWSGWVKRGALGARQHIFVSANPVVNTSGQQEFQFCFDSSDRIEITGGTSGVGQDLNLTTTQVFRDPSAWYHFVVAIDTTQATSSNRMKFYVNGVQVTAFGTAIYPAQNHNTAVNLINFSHRIGGSGGSYLDAYQADINFIDGSQKTPSDFGETDTTTGVWKPKAYSGTYGTNGFYLKFSDIATTSGSNAGLGKDFSGNTNYWTTNNISVTAGTTYDAMTDSPTNTSATVANYCVINPLRRNACTISNANLTASGPATFTKSVVASMSMPSGSGKYYWEAVFTRTSTTDGDVAVGIVSTTWNPGETTGSPSTYPGNTTDSWGVSGNSGNKINNASQTSYGSSFASGDIIMVAYDAVNGSFYVGKNGTWFNSGVPASNTGYAFTGITTEVLPGFGMAYDSGSSIVNANFGQRPFSYTPPTGFVALNTYNLPTPTILQGNKYMNVVTYSGTSATNAISVGFNPDLVWIKQRSGANNNNLFDSVRGANKRISSNLTDAEATYSDTLMSFDTNGFTLGADAGGRVNVSGQTFVGWAWDANGTGVTNTAGSITSTVSVNTTAGFSIVTYTGTGSAATIGHGLGVAPRMIICKARGQAENWAVYHASLGNNYAVFLNTTAAQTGPSNAYWNNTTPTSTVFSVNTATTTNAANTMVAYCWAEIAGFSKFTSYTGNGSADGVFVYLGFRPKFVMIKLSSAATQNWIMFDTSRATTNGVGPYIYANTSGAENSGGAVNDLLDILSNGFKLRGTYGDTNNSGGTYIVAAWAENPFKNSLAR